MSFNLPPLSFSRISLFCYLSLSCVCRLPPRLRVHCPLCQQQARGGRRGLLQPRLPLEHGHRHRQTPTRDPQASQAGQQEHTHIATAPRGQARRRHPEVQELPRQVHTRAGPRESDCSYDVGFAEERAVERRGDDEAEDEAGAAEVREADDHEWGSASHAAAAIAQCEPDDWRWA
ncbi:hypothetical protein Cni_G14401 [Canna indica]|uniref:Uncharacterized protein n=1 Tax=Canna indica TaxID=4628 RepID=A0AAQ3KGC2_9LILI|nr:hypothetical protein Cni_G14401 [Canna indica]